MDKPNVILITTDQHRGDCISVDGNPYIQTPHLDQLAYTGVRFTQAFSECPVCVPARRTLMTGQHGYSHGMHSNRSDPYPSDTLFLAEAFRQKGYQTQAVGKMHTHPQRFRCGFEHVLLNEEGRRIGGLEYDDYEMYLMEHGLRQQLWAHGMPANSLHSRPASLPDEHISDMWTARECCRFFERRDPTAPFFLYCAFRNPHPPLTPAKTYWDLYQNLPVQKPVTGDWVEENEPAAHTRNRCSTNCDLQPETEQIQTIRAYYGLISGIDNQIGMMIGDLRERGWLNNTIILFTADHGEMLFDHKLAHKGLYYQASCRVPFIVSVPPSMRDRFGPGEVRNHPVMLQDVMPTLLNLADIDVPATCDGTSIASIWEDGDAPFREYAFGRYGYGNTAHYGLTDSRMKYMYWVEGGIEQLFNVTEDPNECHDLSQDLSYADELNKWRSQLIAELEKHGDGNMQNGELVKSTPTPIDEKQLRQRSSFNTRGVHW